MARASTTKQKTTKSSAKKAMTSKTKPAAGPMAKASTTTTKSNTSTQKEKKAAEPAKKAFNDMKHLKVKRFLDGDPVLKPGAKRNRAEFPHDAVAEIDPSGRSACKLCGGTITRGETRLVLMPQCHAGYRCKCTLHFDCFWRHEETAKLDDVTEIHVADGVGPADRARIRVAWDETFGDGKQSGVARNNETAKRARS